MVKPSTRALSAGVAFLLITVAASRCFAPELVARQAVRASSHSTLNNSGVRESLTSDTSNSRVLTGYVISESTGEAITNALVRVSASFDLRSVKEALPGNHEARTDAAGRFKFEVPMSDTITFNVFAAGFQEASGPWCGPMRYAKMPFSAAETGDLRIRLLPALYVAGTVVDELKRPVPDVYVESTLRDAGSCAYLEFGRTDRSGHFEIFDFPMAPADFIGGTQRGQVTFEHPDMLRTLLRDIYTLNEAQRTNLQITLLQGHEISGTVTSAAGQPIPGLEINAVPTVESAARKQAITDAQGHFRLRGVQGDVILTAHSLPLKEKAQKRLTVSAENVQLALHLAPIVYTNSPKTYKMLGMTVANITPELQQAYDLFSPTGVLILDPGENHFRLGIGTLSEGDSFWIVGNEVISDLKEMVHQLLLVNSIEPPARPNIGCRGHVRVVYQRPRSGGSSTQFLSLSDNDLEELAALYAELQ